MDTAALVARLVLAAVWLTAGLAKLHDRKTTRKAMTELRVPSRAVPTLSWAVPALEIATGGALLVPLTAWLGGASSTLLLLAFSLLLAVNLSRGRHPVCSCFGSLTARPISIWSLVQNVALLVPAAFVLWRGLTDPGPSPLNWLEAGWSGNPLVNVLPIVAVSLIFVEGVIIRYLLGQYGAALARIDPEQVEKDEGLARGALAPPFSLPGLDGTTVSLDTALGDPRPLMLAFVDPWCQPCEDLVPDLARWQRDENGDVNVMIISAGTAEQSSAKFEHHGVTRHGLVSEGRTTALQYQNPGTPSAVVIDRAGRIGSRYALGSSEIRELYSDWSSKK